MIILGSRKIEFLNSPPTQERDVLRVTSKPGRPMALRSKEAFAYRSGEVPPGYKWYIVYDNQDFPSELLGKPTIRLSNDFEYIDDGDVIRLVPERSELRVLYRRSSSHNSFLVTERCNHYCLMCSQPPRDVDDDWIFGEIMLAIPLIDPETSYLCFSGGEPTLLGDRFLKLIQTCKAYLPNTSLMVLTNGRAFYDDRFAEALGRIEHPDLLLGIPIYSDLAHIHDSVVQADGAFDETLRAMINLRRHGVKTEIRVVLHKETITRLPQLATFIARNLLFADHVALMGLEITGFTRANLERLWIDPSDYRNELREAVETLDRARMRVSVYNAQLCLTEPAIWRFAKRSISDWKQEYMQECQGCSVMDQCAGFFASAKHRYSDKIRPVEEHALHAN
jgi:His-Xaa-Ser system radical SAM maturase HxsC